MADFIGSVISLISKSDIRYVGTLVEINPTESTVSLENVKSHGTEGRKKDPAEEVQGSPQIYEFIVFRGSDVKDLIVNEPAPPPKEPQMPNDPAILGARSHPGRAPTGPYHQGPPGAPGGFQNPNMFPPYPPQGPPQGWGGRGGPPGPGAYGMGYPQQGWYPPGPAGFHNAPPPYYNPGFPGGQPPPGPPGMQQQPPLPQQHQQNQQHQQQGPGPMNNGAGPQSENKGAPIGPGAGQNKAPAPVEMSSDSQVLSQQPINQAAPVAPTPPVASKPSVQEVKQTAALLENQKPSGASNVSKQIPTGPRGATNTTPAAPAMHENAAEAARQAVVQAAIFRLGQTGLGGAGPQAPDNGNDNLSRRFNEMSLNATRAGFHGVRGGGFNRGRGRGGAGAAHGAPPARVEIPKSDFDFAEANAKFNRDDVIKEKIAGTTAVDAPESTGPKDTGEITPAYDKKTSFFDNISTDRRNKELQFDRNAERGKDIDTFGQASVDGGFRRGRGGRGRGSRGRGRGRGYGGKAYPPRTNFAPPGPQ
ncbi:unnamed protein product [Discula destructiva]